MEKFATTLVIIGYIMFICLTLYIAFQIHILVLLTFISLFIIAIGHYLHNSKD